ncbi:Fic family protein [Ottowia thiooxydans]|uniref:Fic family protein n=1 Tax=Ottowia thiooxydans TaxID=219182 RepID=UPI00040D1602|nr:Fic family protein [Ottowia thiooxydans]
MPWIWQLKEWPSFSWQNGLLDREERRFAEGVSVTIGSLRHLAAGERESLTIALLERDALGTSAIEGEVLDRASVQSSLRKHLGLSDTSPQLSRGKPREDGLAEMMADLYREPDAALTHERLFAWHHMLMHGRRDLGQIGHYREHVSPMQIVSGQIGDERVHYEAPPSAQVMAEMEAFLVWFAGTAPGAADALPAITRAAVAHLWFECIHPLEDGNGRIGRAIAEMALAQATSTPCFTGMSAVLYSHRKEYYEQLKRHSVRLDIDEWLHWFSQRALEAQLEADRFVRFLIDKAALLTRLSGQLNPRQEKALLRLFREGPDGFTGGLSAGNYAAITGAPPATTTRDLADLVNKGALRRSGERKSTRYWLAIEAA